MANAAFPFATDRAKFVINLGTSLQRMANITSLSFINATGSHFDGAMSDDRSSLVVPGNIEHTLSTSDIILHDGTDFINILNVNYEDTPVSIIVQSSSSSYVGNGTSVAYNGPSWVFTGVALARQDVGFNVGTSARRGAIFLATRSVYYQTPSF